MNISTPEHLHFAFHYRILPLLQEYFHANPAGLHKLLGDPFFQPAPSIPDDLKESVDPNPTPSLLPPDKLPPAALVAALQALP